MHRISMKTGKKLLRTEWEEELSTQPGFLDKLKLTLTSMIEMMVAREGKRNIKIQWLEVDKSVVKERASKYP